MSGKKNENIWQILNENRITVAECHKAVDVFVRERERFNSTKDMSDELATKCAIDMVWVAGRKEGEKRGIDSQGWSLIGRALLDKASALKAELSKTCEEEPHYAGMEQEYKQLVELIRKVKKMLA